MNYLLSILIVLGAFLNLNSQSNSSIDIVIGGESSYRHVTGSFADITTLDEAIYFDSRTRDKQIINGRFGTFYGQRIGKKTFAEIRNNV